MCFKVGDKVKCLNAAYSNLTVGSVYTVGKIDSDLGFLGIKEVGLYYWPIRFELVEKES